MATVDCLVAFLESGDSYAEKEQSCTKALAREIDTLLPFSIGS